MKHILTSSLFLLTVAFAAQGARVNWATVETIAADGDADPCLANAAQYSAYYITATEAEDIFLSTDVSDVTAHLKAHYAQDKADVAAQGTALTAVNYGLDQYAFTEYSASDLSGSEYMAILFYENAEGREFRVFGKDSLVTYDTSVVFDDLTARAATVGEWTEAAVVPEPTSGLLLLLGFAGLALKRKGL